MPVNVVCQQCGKEFTVPPSAVLAGRGKYCSSACSHRSYAKPVDVMCQQCGVPFVVTQSGANRGEGKYCSRKCSSIANTKTLEEHFWPSVNKNGPIPDQYPELGPCWVWTNVIREDGYGQAHLPGGTSILAHRLSWLIHSKTTPSANVLHHCDIRRCVNYPGGHLFSGTQQDNVDDMVLKGRASSGSLIGSVNPISKLTESKVADIRLRYNGLQYITQKELANEYGVSAAVISMVILRKTWKHVP